jgi:4-hydroxy-tetrahydrodipicolinate reductase
MNIYIVGGGNLANAILSSNLSFPKCDILPWSFSTERVNEKAILIHAGSGRQLDECLDFCERTKSIFVELSTGLKTEKLVPDFPLVICPNTSILMLKTLNMLRLFGHNFRDYEITITESHQSSKTTEPGTAYNFADSLNVSHNKIASIRDAKVQKDLIGIPVEYIDKHAYHKIVIKNNTDELCIETKVSGHDSYANGVKEILGICLNRSLENKRYPVLELMEIQN